jgi:CRP-like cAMP-binding protein
MPGRDLADILEELLAWTKFANNRVLADVLRRSLTDKGAYLTYELSDGTRTQAVVAKQAGVSQPTVSRMYAKWRRLGLVREVDGRDVHLSRPSDLGVESPSE